MCTRWPKLHNSLFVIKTGFLGASMILSKINVSELSNIVNKLKCEKCNKPISEHYTV